MMFPGAGDTVIYNENGEVMGWEKTYERDPLDIMDEFNNQKFDCFECEDTGDEDADCDCCEWVE